MIRVLIVEDSPLAAEILSEILQSDPEIRVVGLARDGLQAVEMTPHLKPDLITMDVWMPGMDGFATVEQIMAYYPTPILVITASLGRSDVDISLTMLAAGALDVIEKPSRLDEATWERSKQDLIRKVKLLAQVRVVTHLKGRRNRRAAVPGEAGAPPATRPARETPPPAPPSNGAPALPTPGRPLPEAQPLGEGVVRFTISAPSAPDPAWPGSGARPAAPGGTNGTPAARRGGTGPLAGRRAGTLSGLPPHPPARPGVNPYSLLTIASSTGGPQALLNLLRHLPADFPLPVVIVQHIAAGFTQGLAEWLSRECGRAIRLASEGLTITPGMIVLAPDGRHLLTGPVGRLHLDDGLPVEIRPAADVFMRSVAAVYGARAIGVILTGMGRDGADGLKAMRWAGAYTIAQDERTSLIFGMPHVAITLGVVDEVLALDDIAPRLCDLVAGRAP